MYLVLDMLYYFLSFSDTLMKFNVMPVNQEDPFFKTVTTNHSKVRHGLFICKFTVDTHSL